MIIGLTGGIASGKSTVSSFLQQLGAVIIDADKIAHKVLKKDSRGYEKVIELFGNAILKDNGDIDRLRLGSIIFNNSNMRKKLENITHPLILAEIHKKLEEYQDKSRIIILDAPLLFEVGLNNSVDSTWVVYIDKNTQISRLMKRDNLTYKEAESRINSQLSLERKKMMADFVINNMGNKENLKEIIIEKWREVNED
ncbi:MAG: dephospho-CoA kinase [Halanaerobiaceae bacterium]